MSIVDHWRPQEVTYAHRIVLNTSTPLDPLGLWGLGTGVWGWDWGNLLSVIDSSHTTSDPGSDAGKMGGTCAKPFCIAHGSEARD